MSLTNEPDSLVNTALDTFFQVTGMECCWLQTISDMQNRQLSLAADRGFTDAMRTEILSMDMAHDFSRQIIGGGHKIIIPDLNNDGAYGLASFRTAGYKWLAAVPLMTYRVYGIFGTASKNRKLLEKDTADLILVVAGLIAGALSKANLSRSVPARRRLPDLTVASPVKEIPTPDTRTEIAPDTPSSSLPPENPVPPPPPVTPQKHVDTAFHAHHRKMESFRKKHR